MLSLYFSMLDTEEEKIKFEYLYRTYKNMAYNYAKQILRDPYLAEDAVHDMFLILSANMKKIENRTERDARNYMIIIVKNISIKIYNDRRHIICVDEMPTEKDELDNIELEIDKRDNLQKIFALIKTMDEKYADVIILKYSYDMKDKEIAKALGITLNNVKIRLHRGMKMLIEKIREEEHEKSTV